VNSEAPNPSTNNYLGFLHLEGQDAAPLSVANVLLRGSTLRNTDYVLGMVLNTGKDTKVMHGVIPGRRI